MRLKSTMHCNTLISLFTILIISKNIFCTDLTKFKVPNYNNILSEVALDFVTNFDFEFATTVYFCSATVTFSEREEINGLIN